MYILCCIDYDIGMFTLCLLYKFVVTVTTLIVNADNHPCMLNRNASSSTLY